MVSKDPNRAISLFWAAINAGDRVDSALKDMAVVMKQLNRSDEGIEAIKSFRYLCPLESQDTIDNLLLELYKVMNEWKHDVSYASVTEFGDDSLVLTLRNGFCVLSQKSGRIEEEAELLEHKLKTLEQEMGFDGRIVRAKRVQGKHVTMTIEQEVARCGNYQFVFAQSRECSCFVN